MEYAADHRLFLPQCKTTGKHSGVQCPVSVCVVRLSAFVMTCFHEAKEFIPFDDDQSASTLSWLVDGQASNGSFYEKGHVIHTEMQVMYHTLSLATEELTENLGQLFPYFK